MKDKIKSVLSSASVQAIMFSMLLSQKIYAQSSNQFISYITGNGWLNSLIQICIIIVAAFEIMKELPKLLAGDGVFASLAKIAAWIAIAIWWDDIINKLVEKGGTERL